MLEWHLGTRRGSARLACASCLAIRCWAPPVPGGGPAPEPGPPWRTGHVQPLVGRGRDEGTETWRGRRAPRVWLVARARARVREPPYVLGAARCACPGA